MKKTDNRVTGAVAMKKRYFCLTSSSVRSAGLSASHRLRFNPAFKLLFS
jgi:hypothetical protein